MQQIALRAEKPDLSNINLHALCKRTELLAVIAAALDPHPLACGSRKLRQHVGRERLLARSTEGGSHALGVGPSLIARCLERRDALLEVRVIHIGNAVLDSVKEAL
ncbi:hypothetical protein [Sphingopyxis terrae]|uniref:hypothetical protein n=1 Tax=Sphingopyxis terrae TaxID=33052 RepID=UPI002A0AB836|nr:hypothetical protein [Sphingopyxis terrae]MDX8359077.1 hypothetical protein [Sphingopyxis terrae]